ncbi:MAG: hypothetical protein IPN15_20210 [Saprospiraceae bacterium]|nr:hypothetical protein [Candidatus Vicinibacter affinis]
MMSTLKYFIFLYCNHDPNDFLQKEESTSDLLNTMAVENKYPAIISGNGILDEDFSPVNVEEAKLLEKTGEMFYDFPLENEMIQMGDYYPQPGKEFPEVWAVVCPGFQSPISVTRLLHNLSSLLMNPF